MSIPGPVPGTNVAYWGPELKVGVPQPALNVGMDAHTNVESMSFSFDGLTTTLPIVMIHNQETKVPIPIPIPAINPLQPPLGAGRPFPMKVESINGTAKWGPVRASRTGAGHGLLRPRSVIAGRGA